MTNSCIQSWGSGLVIWQMSLNDTLCPSQVWINWSSFRATRTRRSIRKPSTWSSATSTRRTKTRRWLPPWTCSSSSSSFSSARPRWKASSYNPAPPAYCAPVASRSPSAHLSHSMPTANLRRPRLPRSFDIDLIIIMITKKNKQKQRCTKKRSSPIWVKSCQPVCQGVSSRSSLCWAHRFPLNSTHWSDPQCLSLADSS